MPNWTKEQLDAINKDNSNIIVSAGAGSGKTAVLSERVIRKLKDGVHINELLILTFTNAAAKEMKDRIRRKIKENGLIEELKYIDNSYITTFDSYCLSILKKYHFLLNIDKNLKIVDADLIKYKKEKILDEIFEEKYKNKDNDFIDLITTFCTKDDNSIRKSILDIAAKLDLKLNTKLDDYYTLYYEDSYLNGVIDDLNEKLINKINNIKLLTDNLSYYVESDYNIKINEVLLRLFNSSSYDDIVQNLNIDLPRLSTEYEEAKELKKHIKKEIDELSSICVYENTAEIKNSILSTKKYVKVIIDIIKELNDRVFSFKYENDLYEFNDIAKLSIKIIKENKDIREEIKNSFNEIMIDEYQDTNDIQEEFISLISNNNVYMVGDIKQSIYRFRNANPYIFKNKYDSYSNNEGGIKIDLNKNFRSREETLNNINKVFGLIMDDIIGGANYKLTHEMIFGNSSYNEKGKTSQNNDFEIYNYDYNKDSIYTREENEIFLIANDIKEKIENKYKIFDKDTLEIRDCTYKDFVILLDRTTDFSLYKKIFEFNNIPLTILKDESVSNEQILLIIKNFLISLVKIHNNNLDNEFKHAFVSILRSFIFEYTDEQIFELFLNNSFKENEIFKELKSINIDAKSTKDIIKTIVNKFNIISSLSKIGNIESNLVIIEFLYNYLDTKEEIGYTIEDIVEYLNEITSGNYEIKYSNKASDSNSVKIMTIHKSKGLEYSICYYAGLYKSFNIRDIKERFLYDKKYGIITPIFNEGIDETIYKFMVKDDFIKEEISEKIRLLYVAFTRAKEKMILIADLNGENYSTKDDSGVIDLISRLNYKSFLDIIISIKKELEKYIVDKKDFYISKDYLKIKKVNYKDYIKQSNIELEIKELDKDNSIIEESSFSKKHNSILSKEELENMDYGKKIHSIFELEDFNNPSSDEVKEFLNIYNKKDFNNTYKEYEFMYEEDNNIYHGIIDLMFEYDEFIDIIDYKLSNVEDEAYKKQLDGYKKFIGMKTNKVVNVYLYSIMKKKLIKLDI